MSEEQEKIGNNAYDSSLELASSHERELLEPGKSRKSGVNLFEKIEGYYTNIYFCVSFIVSNLIAFFLLPDRISIYYLEDFTHGKTLNRFEVTLFWIFLSGGILSIHFLVLVLLSENMSVKMRVRKKLAKARVLFMGMFTGGWLAMFYVQWDGVYYAITGKPLLSMDVSELAPLAIIFFTALLNAVIRWRALASRN